MESSSGKIRALVAGLIVLLIGSNGYWVLQNREQYRVTKVTDGDTFWIKSGDRVRLLGVNAPEKGLCGSTEAAQKLTELVENKIISLEEEKRDEYGRRMGLVYVGNTLVNLEMVKTGWRRINYDPNSRSEEFKEIWKTVSPKCKNVAIPKKGCTIKANIDQGTGQKFYHLPNCRHYSQIVLDSDLGEGYYCMEKEAQAAGFKLAPDCLR